MSKHTVSTKGGATAVEGHTSRRAALRALIGAGALAIPAIGSTESALGDPIFTAIERHKAAYEAALALSFAIDEAINNPEGREASEAEWDACEQARKNEEAAFDELVTGTPKTAAGMRAIIGHLISLDDGRLSQKMKQLLALLLTSRVLAS
jgi:hypothetical protein